MLVDEDQIAKYGTQSEIANKLNNNRKSGQLLTATKRKMASSWSCDLTSYNREDNSSQRYVHSTE